MTLLIRRSELETLVSTREIVDAVEKTFEGLGNGTVINPTKVHLNLGDQSDWPPYHAGMNAMPAYVGWLDIAGLKWVGGWEDNMGKGLPYIRGMILLVKPSDGEVLAVMDGAWITNGRTGAQSAVTLKHLAKKGPLVVGLFGAGAQGRTQALAMIEALPLEELKIYDIRPEAAKSLAADMNELLPGKVRVAESIAEAADSDAVVTVTHSRGKFLKPEMIRPGATVCALGSYTECSDELILGADRIFVDHIGQCLHRGALKEVSESGRLSEKDISATIGEVVAGVKPGRTDPGQRILCVPIGTGCMDVAVAGLAYKKALESGKGTSFSFD